MKRKIVSGIMFTLLLVSMVMLTFNIQIVNSQPGTLLSLSPLESTASVGETFTVDVVVTEVTDMKGCFIKLGYNKTILHAVRVDPTAITKYATQWNPPKPLIPIPPACYWDCDPVINNTRTDPTTGLAYIWIGCWGFTTYTGTGVVFIIEFTAISAGDSTLHLFDVELLDSLSEPIEHDTLDGSVSIPAPVGGIYIPANKPELLAPYIRLTILLAVVVVTVGYVKKRNKDTKINP